MKTIRILQALIFLYLPLQGTSQNIQQTATEGQTYAVIIGISKYQSTNITPLQYADKDAQIFADYLVSANGGNTPQENIRLITNEQAKIAEIYNALDWLKNKVQENDQAYIYFSGHGDVETDNNNSLGYLLAYNTPSINYRNNAISLEDINQDANFMSLEKKANVVLIMDACHAGSLAGDFFKGKQLVGKRLQTVLNNEVRLTSCAADELAAEGEDWGGGRGAFSYYLIKGLNGFAEENNDQVIKLNELTAYLDSCFTVDPILISQRHKQKPVLDGHPEYPMALESNNSFAIYRNKDHENVPNQALLGALSIFKPVEKQPIDLFFDWLDEINIEHEIPFKKYEDYSLAEFTLQFTKDIGRIINSDLIEKIHERLKTDKVFQVKFSERFVLYVHNRGQKMINDYLNGDITELRHRDYYELKNLLELKDFHYDSFLDMIYVAMNLVPTENHLANTLKINYNYLAGLIARINMATSMDFDSLLNIAFSYQKEALNLDANTAYIHNELGNLYRFQKDYKTAEAHLKIAAEIAPTWVIPWVNFTSVFLAQNKIGEAKLAIEKAESLKPGLEYQQMNAGLVFEEEKDWLSAESLYLQAIDKNRKHFFPYERLGFVYLAMADYKQSQKYFIEAARRNKGLSVAYFREGISAAPSLESYDQRKNIYCVGLKSRLNSNQKEFEPFIDGFLATEPDSLNDKLAIEKIKLGLDKHPKMPLAKHILGKVLYKQGDWSAALEMILEAKKEYLNDEYLENELIKTLKLDTRDSVSYYCLLDFFTFYQYEPLEDDYLLAAIYEHLDQANKAIEQYQLIVLEENRRPQEIELFKNFEKSEYRLLGAMKLAQFYEKLENYELAENTLLDQFEANRNLLNLRVLRSDIEQIWSENTIIYEIEIYDFYKRMISKFPRDFLWKEKAGFRNYNKIKQDYMSVPINEYIEETNTLFIKFSTRWFDNIVLGTDERYSASNIYYPAEQAYEDLSESIKLYGGAKPKIEVLKAMGDLASWIEKFDESIEIYYQVLEQKADVDTRSKLIKVLNHRNRMPESLKQLKKLKVERQISDDQKLQLARFLMYINKKKAGFKLMKKLDSLSLEELRKNYLITLNLTGDLGKGDRFLKKSLAKMYPLKEVAKYYYDSLIINNETLYTQARQMAFQNKDELAFQLFKKALDQGFYKLNVIEMDKAWENKPKFRSLIWNESE